MEQSGNGVNRAEAVSTCRAEWGLVFLTYISTSSRSCSINCNTLTVTSLAVLWSESSSEDRYLRVCLEGEQFGLNSECCSCYLLVQKNYPGLNHGTAVSIIAPPSNRAVHSACQKETQQNKTLQANWENPQSNPSWRLTSTLRAIIHYAFS